MADNKGYFNTGDKISKVTEDGLRINVYPSGVVTGQMPGQSHTQYKEGLGKGFSEMTPSEMSERVSDIFKK